MLKWLGLKKVARMLQVHWHICWQKMVKPFSCSTSTLDIYCSSVAQNGVKLQKPSILQSVTYERFSWPAKCSMLVGLYQEWLSNICRLQQYSYGLLEPPTRENVSIGNIARDDRKWKCHKNSLRLKHKVNPVHNLIVSSATLKILSYVVVCCSK